jgi:hypothetical protein
MVRTHFFEDADGVRARKVISCRRRMRAISGIWLFWLDKLLVSNSASTAFVPPQTTPNQKSCGIQRMAVELPNFTSCFRNKLPSPQLFRLVRVQSLLAAKLWNNFAVFLSIAGVNRGYGPAGDVPIPSGDRCEKGLHSVIRTSVVLDVDHAAVFERRTNWTFRYSCPSKFCGFRLV